jgi:hypothetical protein
MITTVRASWILLLEPTNDLTGKDAPNNNNTDNKSDTNTQGILRRSQRKRTGRVTFAEASKPRKKIAKMDGQGPAPKLAPKTAQAKEGN